MKTLLCLALFSLACLIAQTSEYTMIDLKIAVNDIPEFMQLGLSVDECETIRQENYWYYRGVIANRWEMEQLKNSRFPFQVVADDAEKFYASRFTPEELELAQEDLKTRATQMKLGTMGGFYKLEEVYATLDELTQKYSTKGLITQKFSIGKSFEGRDIYAIKISDQAGQNEDEPQVLYTALTHAREPQGMMTVIYFMYYLLENYETNSRVRNIVDNREIYFIPVVNPDGYYYNQKNSPNGGGMRRKNCNGSGIDLNRNFGPRELWDYPNGGSSTSSYSETYRGTAEFSEKETASLRDFALTKKFKTALNYHTYSNLLIYPWGYKNEIAHPMFPTMAKEMTKINGYRHGTAQGLLYAVRGDSDSWFFKVPYVFAMTPEAGSSSDGFWPKSSRIFILCEENLEANLLLAEYAGQVPATK